MLRCFLRPSIIKTIRGVKIGRIDFPEDDKTNVTEKIIKKVEIQQKKHLEQKHPVQIIKNEIYNFFNTHHRQRNWALKSISKPFFNIYSF